MRRLIPAWAGKTRRHTRRCAITGAHPRVGGENHANSRRRLGLHGSSPRGRGKLGAVCLVVDEGRLIPAWAGKTRKMARCALSAGAHPRVGGENAANSRQSSLVAGSSPRGRGKHARGPRQVEDSGLIPAWAGKTDCLEVAGRELKAHPRVGGENRVRRASRARANGSSPRGRGKHRHGMALADESGLIPAWAGKTPARCGCRLRRRAHPRVGGENVHPSRRTTAASGSSPRGRGKPQRQHEEHPDPRLIPAWAGKTSPRDRTRCRDRAHPRVGGENTF